MTDLSTASRRLQGANGETLVRTATEYAGAELVAAKLRGIHTRGGRSLSHVYEATLHTGVEARDVLIVAHVDRRGYPDGAFTLTDGDLEVAVWRFPNDPYLPGLASAIDAGRVRELLDRLDGPPGRIQLRTRAYRPSRRAVVEVTVHGEETEGRVLYLKVLAGDRARELGELHQQLAAHVPVPRVIGVAPAQGILAMEALGGVTLRAALLSDAPLPNPDAFVALSQRFAASGLSSRRDPRAFADVARHVDLLTSLAPDRASAIRRVADRAGTVTGELAPVHGDLHDGQILLHGDAITGLLDVDGSGDGHLAHDAGNLVAHVAVLAELWPQFTDRVEAYAATIADAYRPLVGGEALARATAGAWLGLATGPHRAQDPDWPDTTRSRIDRAARELTAG